MTVTSDGRFRAAALAYFCYGVVYWLGGAWLAWQGIGVRSGGLIVWRGMLWLVLGLVFLVLIPYVLRRRRWFFERWVLSRRDFARILCVFMAFRAFAVSRVMLRPDGASIPAPWGGLISFRTGAFFFFVVTVAACVLVAWAAWSEETT